MSKKPYFPNNWHKFKNAPDDAFFTPTWEDFEEWKISGWEIPDSVYCIIRAEIDGKVKEYTYQRAASAHKKIQQLVEARSTFTVADNEAIHHSQHSNDSDSNTIDE